jgi:hypothetical protein
MQVSEANDSPKRKEKTLVELKLTLIKSAFSPITKNTCCPHG